MRLIGDSTYQELLAELRAGDKRSAMTLFEYAAPAQPMFGAVLALYFDCLRDETTERLPAFKAE